MKTIGKILISSVVTVALFAPTVLLAWWFTHLLLKLFESLDHDRQTGVLLLGILAAISVAIKLMGASSDLDRSKLTFGLDPVTRKLIK